MLSNGLKTLCVKGNIMSQSQSQEIAKQTETVDMESSEFAQLAEDQADEIYNALADELKNRSESLAEAEKELAELEAAESPDNEAIAEKTGECEEAAAELANHVNDGLVIADCITHNLLQIGKDLAADYDITDEG